MIAVTVIVVLCFVMVVTVSSNEKAGVDLSIRLLDCKSGDGDAVFRDIVGAC